MANASTLKDIDDKFCVCFICRDQLKEPKVLTCLHRFCKDCLRPIVRESNDVIKCPICRHDVKIPRGGVEGFKTDFFAKKLVEYVKSQQSGKSGEIPECRCCPNHRRAVAYCFKCNEFLCKHCKQFHLTNELLVDHQKHTLSLEEIEAKNIKIGKLVSMRDAPRCHIHHEEISKMFCETCGYLPLCMKYVHSDHKGHNLHEVKELARLKKEELINILKALEDIEESKKSVRPRQEKQHFILNVTIEKHKVEQFYDGEDQKIITKIQDTEGRLQQVKQEKRKTEKKIFDSWKEEMDMEIQKVKKRYEEILQQKKLEISHKFDGPESSLEKKLTTLRETRERVQNDKEQVLESIEKQLNENVKIIETMSQHFDDMKQRLETLNLMASGILASDNSWSAVRCIPDMCTAATNLMKDLEKDFPDLTTLLDMKVNFKQHLIGKPSVTNISDEAEREISINDPNRIFIFGMTSSGDGNIVISGFTSDVESSFIIVVDINGRIVQEKKLNTGKHYFWQYCKYLSQHKVVSVRTPNEIGLYDVRDGSYIKKNIIDIINSWPNDRNVRSVATDPVNNHVLVGGQNNRDVYVFDDQLNYLHILTLPETIKWPRDMTVSVGHLLVCDEKKCYVTTMDGLESKVVGEFMGPNLEEGYYRPVSVCTDEYGFVYVLWKGYSPGYQCKLCQYKQDGCQVFTTRNVDGDAQVITVVETSQGNKLLVATLSTQRVFLYDLIAEGSQSLGILM